MKRKVLLSMAILMAWASGFVFGQETNAPVKSDYSFFKSIPDRNIFNPNRVPRRSGPRRPEVTRTSSADTFALVGTMSYEKGTYAFFDGSTADLQKVLERDGEIAGFKLKTIEPNSVVLTAGDKPVELKVGASMRRDPENGWQPAGETATLAPMEHTDSAVPAPASPTPAASDSGEPSDVLKKLMQQREQELR